MAKILIVDDNLSFRTVLAETITALKHDVLEAGFGFEALSLLQSMTPDLVLLDLRLPDMTGIEILRAIRKNPDLKSLPVVILTAYADSSNTIDAMKNGAFDHLTKPIKREEIKTILEKVLASSPAAEESKDGDKVAAFSDRLIGESTAFREVEKLIGMALSTSTPVLILGESGSGKEKIARTLYHHSEMQKPFLLIPCSSFLSHVPNWQEQGTIYLEELGDLDVSAQAQLITLLKEDNSGPRIISSSKYEIDTLLKKTGLREDLYYRLAVFPIKVPPLRERTSDILLLAEAFLNRERLDLPRRFTSAAAKALLEYSWPGNVRELFNRVSRAAVVARGTMIDAGDLSFANENETADPGLTEILNLDFFQAVARVEKMLLQNAIQKANGNRTEAARDLGINRQLLYAKLKEHGIT